MMSLEEIFYPSRVEKRGREAALNQAKNRLTYNQPKDPLAAYLTLSGDSRHPDLLREKVLRDPEIHVAWWSGIMTAPSWFGPFVEAPTDGLRTYHLRVSRDDLLALLNDDRIAAVFKRLVILPF